MKSLNHECSLQLRSYFVPAIHPTWSLFLVSVLGENWSQCLLVSWHLLVQVLAFPRRPQSLGFSRSFHVCLLHASTVRVVSCALLGTNSDNPNGLNSSKKHPQSPICEGLPFSLLQGVVWFLSAKRLGVTNEPSFLKGTSVGVAESCHLEKKSRGEHYASHFLKNWMQKYNVVRITAIVIYRCQIRQRNRMINPAQGGQGQFAEKNDVLTIFIICKLFHTETYFTDFSP